MYRLELYQHDRHIRTQVCKDKRAIMMYRDMWLNNEWSHTQLFFDDILIDEEWSSDIRETIRKDRESKI